MLAGTQDPGIWLLLLLFDQVLAFQALPWCQPDISSVCYKQSQIIPAKGSLVLQDHRAAPVHRKFAGGISCIAEMCADCSPVEK